MVGDASPRGLEPEQVERMATKVDQMRIAARSVRRGDRVRERKCRLVDMVAFEVSGAVRRRACVPAGAMESGRGTRAAARVPDVQINNNKPRISACSCDLLPIEAEQPSLHARQFSLVKHAQGI
jgi:hypothetical protein